MQAVSRNADTYDHLQSMKNEHNFWKIIFISNYGQCHIQGMTLTSDLYGCGYSFVNIQQEFVNICSKNTLQISFPSI